MDRKYIRDRERCDAIMAALTSAAEDQTLTAEQLAGAVWIYFDERESWGWSIGLSWIKDHYAAFRAVVQDVEAFFRDRFAAIGPVENILGIPELMADPSVDRSALVRDLYVSQGSYGTRWVSDALRFGVGRDTLRQAIRKHLERVPAIDEQDNSYTTFHDFLRHGIGDATVTMSYDRQMRMSADELLRELPADAREKYALDPDTPWGVFDDVEFLEVMLLCAFKAPALTLQSRRRLILRLQPEQVQEICLQAAENLTSVGGQSLGDLRLLPLEDRLDLARRLKIKPGSHASEDTARFLIDLIVQLGNPLGRKFYDEVGPTLDQIGAMTLWHTWRKQYEVGGQQHMSWLDEELKRRLMVDGYAFGTIEEGIYRDRHGRSNKQWRVRVGNTIYVQDRSQHRYFPRAGDRVLFRPGSGARLTPHVVAVMFYPTQG